MNVMLRIWDTFFFFLDNRLFQCMAYSALYIHPYLFLTMVVILSSSSVQFNL